MLFRNRQLRRGFILLLDFAAIFLAFLLSWFVRFKSFTGWEREDLYISTLLVTGLLYAIVFFMQDNSRKSLVKQGAFENLVSVIKNSLLLLAYLVVYLFVTQFAILVSRYVIGFMFAFFLVIDYAFRMLYRLFLIRVVGSGLNATNVMLITLNLQIFLSLFVIMGINHYICSQNT